MSDLPAALSSAVRELAEGRRDLAQSAGRISEHYRSRGSSREVIGGAGDAIAYALSRMPATYAAVSAVLAELRERAGSFAPATVLDAGAGPGTAAWAVAELYPDADLSLMDHNRQFLQLAETLGHAAGAGQVARVEDDLARFELGRTFALVTCAYALTELPDAMVGAVVDRLWRHCEGVLVIVEPGRPRDYQRLMQLRDRLIGQGATVLAPCPHERACPLLEPDWCHFSVRLNRSRDHMRMKGGTLGYEDEKFSYLIVARPGIGRRVPGRVLRKPEENKFSVTLAVCGEAGLEQRVVPSRDKPSFKAAKKLDWGDAV